MNTILSTLDAFFPVAWNKTCYGSTTDPNLKGFTRSVDMHMSYLAHLAVEQSRRVPEGRASDGHSVLHR